MKKAVSRIFGSQLFAWGKREEGRDARLFSRFSFAAFEMTNCLLIEMGRFRVFTGRKFVISYAAKVKKKTAKPLISILQKFRVADAAHRKEC